jgi:TonB dependent receptor
VLDNFSWNHGKHSIRFGGEYRYDIYNQFGNQYTRSQLQFNGQYTANPQTLAGGNAAADFFMGSPYRVDLALTLAEANDTANSLAFYVDDTYKMTSKLTLSLGLRWELVQPWLDTNQNMLNFQFKTGLPAAANVDPSLYPTYVRPGTGDFYQGLDFRYVNLTGVGQPGPITVARDGRLGDRLVNTDWRNFAPRFGIAYSPSSKWSIRTGFGIFYSQETGNSKFDLNRGSSGRLTDLPGTQTAPTLTYGNSYSTAILPVLLNPGLTWAIDQHIKTPTSMMYLLDVQRQLGSASTFEAV